MIKNGFEIGYLCEIGDLRKINQDAILIETYSVNGDTCGLFAVADGVGGLSFDDLTSSSIINMLKSWWENVFISKLLVFPNKNAIAESLDDVLNNSNRALYNTYLSTGVKTATTLSLLLIVNNFHMIRNVGDSRIYSMVDDISQVTIDDTLQSEKDSGKSNILTKCIGLTKTVDFFKLDQFVDSHCTYLICSDGFYNFVTEIDVFDEFYNSTVDFQNKVNRLRLSIPPGYARDNISLIAVKGV